METGRRLKYMSPPDVVKLAQDFARKKPGSKVLAVLLDNNTKRVVVSFRGDDPLFGKDALLYYDPELGKAHARKAYHIYVKGSIAGSEPYEAKAYAREFAEFKNIGELMW